MRVRILPSLSRLALAPLLAVAAAQAAPSVPFESGQVRPLALSPYGPGGSP